MSLLYILSLLALLNSCPVIPITFTPEHAQEIVLAYEIHYQIPGFYRTLQCESGLNPKATNLADAHGGSFGIAQINASHGFSQAQMYDPVWSLTWSAHMFAEGQQNQWSCYRA